MRALLVLCFLAGAVHAGPPNVRVILVPREVEVEETVVVLEPYTVERKVWKTVYRPMRRKVKEWKAIRVPYPVERVELRTVYVPRKHKVPRPVLEPYTEEGKTTEVVLRKVRQPVKRLRLVYVPHRVERRVPRMVYREEDRPVDVWVSERVPVFERVPVVKTVPRVVTTEGPDGCARHEVVPHQEPGTEVSVRLESRSWKEERMQRERVPRLQLVPEREVEHRLEPRVVEEIETHYVPRLEVVTRRETRYRPGVRLVEETERVPMVRPIKFTETEYRVEHRMVEREEVDMVPRQELVTERETLYRPVARKVKRRRVEYGQRVEVITPAPTR